MDVGKVKAIAHTWCWKKARGCPFRAATRPTRPTTRAKWSLVLPQSQHTVYKRTKPLSVTFQLTEQMKEYSKTTIICELEEAQRGREAGEVN